VFIREELEARGWSQSAFAEILGRPFQVVNAICNGKKAITPQTAVEFAEAFGTSAELLFNLETSWQLSRVKKPDPGIAKRVRQIETSGRREGKALRRRSSVSGGS